MHIVFVTGSDIRELEQSDKLIHIVIIVWPWCRLSLLGCMHAQRRPDLISWQNVAAAYLIRSEKGKILEESARKAHLTACRQAVKWDCATEMLEVTSF